MRLATIPVVVLIALFAAVFAAQAQGYPSRPITLIVPYAAGGGNDLMARTAAEKISKTLGQQIVIENRGGAGGSIATRAIAKAAPDGYTLGLGGTGTLAINPTLYGNVGYDPRKDFAPVGLIATSTLVVCVHPSLSARSIGELIALAKAQPGNLNYASAGTGSGIHLGTEYFATMAGIKLTHIPYKGSGPALTDLVGGHVDGAEPRASTPEEYAADIDRGESKWSAIVKASGAKAEGSSAMVSRCSSTSPRSNTASRTRSAVSRSRTSKRMRSNARTIRAIRSMSRN